MILEAKKGKQYYINVYFNYFKNKIKICAKLHDKGYSIEAATLLCCYIDALANYRYGFIRGESKKHFCRLVEEYSPYAIDLKKSVNGRKISESLYILYRCGWIHSASPTRPSPGDQFTIEVEDIGSNGEKWTNISFPWHKMVETANSILSRLRDETLRDEIHFIK